MKALVAALLLVSPLPSLRAQSAEEWARIAEQNLCRESEIRLLDDDLATVTWGAHMLAEHVVRDAEPALRKALARLAALPAQERLLPALAVLDALHRIGAELEPQELQEFDEPLELPLRFAFAARDPTRHADFLMEQVRMGTRWNALAVPWHTAGNLLAGCRYPEFARTILPLLGCNLQVIVRDAGSEAWAVISCFGRAGERARSAAVRIPPGYPPVVLYELTISPEVGDSLLAPGEIPVFLRRVVRNRSYRRDPGGICLRGVEVGAMSAGWLATMLRTTKADLGLPLHDHVALTWHDAATLRRDAEALRATIAADYRKVVRRCVEGGFLDATLEASIPAPIRLWVEDLRVDRGVPLPDLDAHD